MAIGPIEIQGAISRTQDFAQIRHNEENKGHVDQTNIAQNTSKEVETKAFSVNRGDDVSDYQKQFDAREKGSNEYHGDGGKHRNDNKKGDGKVIVKGISSGFDVKI